MFYKPSIKQLIYLKRISGFVIGNQAGNFSVGANIGMIFMMAEQEYDELNMAIKMFQDTMMRVRYSSIPVVVAPHGMTLVVDAK
jgi:3-hydroxyacyl-CoA dehydrogenase